MNNIFFSCLTNQYNLSRTFGSSQLMTGADIVLLFATVGIMILAMWLLFEVLTND